MQKGNLPYGHFEDRYFEQLPGVSVCAEVTLSGPTNSRV